MTRPFLTAAHACRIDGIIKATGGAITLDQIADRLGIAPTTVRDVIHAKHWSRRIGRIEPKRRTLDPEVEPVELVFEDER